MNNQKYLFSKIGTIHTSFREKSGIPIQSSFSDEVGSVEIFPEFQKGLKDLDGFSHIYLIYHFDRSAGFDLSVTPFLDDVPRGVFSTRAPRRPNPIGISVVEIIGIKESIIEFNGADMLDNTPLLDIKPFVPDFEPSSKVKTGWLEGNVDNQKRSDNRFE